MTIKEARKVLGDKVAHLSDEELLKKMIDVDEDLEQFFSQVQKTLDKQKKN